MAPPDEARSSRPVVVFYTDNGMGLGHITRQLAIARRARGAFQPLFLTMSAGYTLPRRFGIPTEYFPSYGTLGVAKDEWEPLIAERLREIIETSDARAVVVDHVSPPRVFAELRESSPATRFLWSRRGLWQPEKNRNALGLGESFDLVIEPGDVAALVDQGPTAVERHDTVGTRPIVLVRHDEYLTRRDARSELGIPGEGRSVLVNLGDRSSVEVRRMIERARDAVKRHAGADAHVFAPLHPLHGAEIGAVDGVLMAPVYPVAKYFNAFDAVISSSGYNSFHEVVDSGLPAVFVPHQGARIDDQVRRAEFAQLCGRAHWAPTVFGRDFEHAVSRMLRAHEPAAAAATTRVLGPMNGADEFADVITALISSLRRGRPGAVGRGRPTSNRSIRDRLVSAVDLDDRQLSAYASSLSPDEIGRTIVAVGHADTSPLREREIAFETVMSPDELRLLGGHDHDDYVSSRIARMAVRYGSSSTTDVSGEQSEVIR